MKRKTVDEITTLTLLDGVAGCALDPDVFDDPPFPCEAFACCDCDRRDETSVILRRVDGSDAVDDSTSNEETESPFK